LRERKAALETLLRPLGQHALIRYVEHFETAGDAVLRSACRMSLEGIISKRLDAPYRSGRSELWCKAKCRAGHEVVVGAWTSEGPRFRSLIVGVHKDNKLVHVGNVGTGFGGAKVTQLMPRLKKAASNKSPFADPKIPRQHGQVHWLKPELVAEIEFAGWTGDGRVRQASFKGLREDKPADAVQAEEPIPATTAEMTEPKPKKAAGKKGAAPSKPPAKGDNVVMGVVISNPDKPFWPDDGDGQPITKLELARYFEAVGEWMLPYVQGRPCTIVRYPDGIKGEHIYQRHPHAGTSSLISLVPVRGLGDNKPFLQVDRVEALIAFAQMGTIEVHPWNSTPG